MRAPNRTESVRDFVTMAFKAIGRHIAWQGQGSNEIGVDDASGKTLVRVNEKYYRPAEVDLLIGNADRAKNLLGWEPATELEELCSMMVAADLARNERGFSF